MPSGRRQFLAMSAMSTAGLLSVGADCAAAGAAPDSAGEGRAGDGQSLSADSKSQRGVAKPPLAPFRYCLNTSTIRGQELGIEEEVSVAGAAGYDGIEPWIRSITQFVDRGGRLEDLRRRIEDAGLTVDSAIGFAQWIVDDPARRREGLEEARRDMEMLRSIGGTRIAAPPAGAAQGPKLDLLAVAERYRALLELGEEAGVVPQLEVWGFSNNLSRLGETLLVCAEASHPQACLLPDVYHIFRGGSGFGGLQLLSDAAIHVFHLNDYPADPSREQMTDAHRVFPGDGVAPLTEILRLAGGQGRHVILSLELFNREYWERDAVEVARTGLEKMRAAAAAASV